jgi:hypothetical protein
MTTASPVTIDAALYDKRLLGAALGDASTWSPWIATLKAAFGLPLSESEQRLFRQVAGDRPLPKERIRELWCCIGRRGGKSRMAAAIAVYLAVFGRYRLAPGETGYVVVISMTQDQSKVVFDFCLGFLQASSTLRKEIVDTTRNEIRLRNGITIMIHSCDFRSVRGRTIVAVVFDEVARWRDEGSATPDSEVYTAVLPSLLTTHGLLVAISSPYRRLGLLWTKFRDHFGKASDDCLVVTGGTTTFNTTVTEADLVALREADPAASASEWDGQFRTDVGAFLDDELIDAAIDRARPLELAPVRGRFYKAFTDPSGGVGRDSYTLAIAHREEGRFVIDCVRGTPSGQKFDPYEITRQYADCLKEHNISTVTGDKYAREWVASAWRAAGISYITSPLAKPEIYLETIPLFSRGLVKMPDHTKLVRELRLLERIPSRSGKDSVDHPRGDHDDHANSACGALRSLSSYLGHGYLDRGWLDDRDTDDQDAGAAFQHARLRQRIFELSGGRFLP